MNCVVEQLEKNMHYRLLHINGEHYILDMERSLLKIIFPFLFWILPSTAFKIDNQATVDKLRESNREETRKPAMLPLAGFGYFVGILLAPLMAYFEISTGLLTNLLSVVLTLIFVALIFFTISHQNKKKLYDVVNLEAANVKGEI